MKRTLTVWCVFFGLTVFPAAAQAPVDENYLKAQAYEQMGKYQEARDIYERLFQLTGNDLYYWRIMLVYERIDDFKNMEALALSRLQSHPDEMITQRYLAAAYYGQGVTEKAHQVVMQMIGNRWNDIARISLAAGELISHNDYDLAFTIYMTAREKNNNNSVFSHELARIYLSRFDYAGAIEEYLKTIDSVEITYVNIETAMNSALKENYDPEALAQPLERYLTSNPKGIKAARLLSQLYYKTGDYRTAFDVLVPVAAGTDNVDDIWNLANNLRKAHHIPESIMVYENYYRLFPKDPRRPEALLNAADLKKEIGDRAGAHTHYQKLANDYKGTMGAALATIRIFELSEDIMTGEGYTNALKEFASTTQYRSVAYEAYLALARAYMIAGDFAGAQQALLDARIKAREKDEIYAVVSRSAIYYFYAGDVMAMSREVDSSIEYGSEGDEINNLLTLKLLGMKCSTNKDRAGFSTFAHGRYALYIGKTDEAVDSLTVAAQDMTVMVSSPASAALAELYRDQGEYRKSCEWYMHAAEAAQDTTERVKAMIDAADILRVSLNDAGNARSLYFKALTAYPGTVYDSVVRRKLRDIVE